MKLLLKREPHPDYTVGKLYINGVYECFTLEDPVRETKIHGETAIPYGTYNVIINQSARFKRELPLLLNVKNFAGVRIHPGNTVEDTEGCILVGTTRTKNGIVLNSVLAFKSLFKKMKESKTPITLEIT
jgi:hypothetical protein